MKVIIVKYHGPTDTKGARLTATAEGVKPLTESVDYSDDRQQKGKLAVKLALRQGWRGMLKGGTLPDGRAVYVFNDAQETWQIPEA